MLLDVTFTNANEMTTYRDNTSGVTISYPSTWYKLMQSDFAQMGDMYNSVTFAINKHGRKGKLTNNPSLYIYFEQSNEDLSNFSHEELVSGIAEGMDDQNPLVTVSTSFEVPSTLENQPDIQHEQEVLRGLYLTQYYYVKRKNNAIVLVGVVLGRDKEDEEVINILNNIKY